MSKGQEFRRLLQENDYVFTTGVGNAIDARIAEKVGLKVVYMSGYSTSLAMLARADLGFASMTEVTTHAEQIVSATSLPVIADADDGYGNALITMRTVEKFERAGVAGIHIEDQQGPKRCGHLAGKRVIPLEEAEGKFRAAMSARQDPDFVIIARTDARDALGGSLEEAILRGKAYANLGVDMVWAEFGSPDAVAEFEGFAQEVRKERPDLPLAFNYSSSLKWGPSQCRLTFSELGQMGYKFIFISLGAAHASMHAVWSFMEDLRDHQEQAQFRLEDMVRGHPTEDHHAMGNIEQFQALEREFMPGDGALDSS